MTHGQPSQEQRMLTGLPSRASGSALEMSQRLGMLLVIVGRFPVQASVQQSLSTP